MAVLVGKPAPDFVASAVLGNNEIVERFSLSEAIRNRHAVLFFYPLDFTFVCPSELIAFDHRLEEFRKRQVEVIGVSIDSAYTHFAWKSAPAGCGGVGPLGYPLVADTKHEIARAYDVEAESGVALRATFVIDRCGIVQHQLVNNLALGRDIDETLRLIDALQFTEQNGEVCPAGWALGKAAIKASPDGIADYLSRFAQEL